MTGGRAAALVTGAVALLALLVPASPAGADTVITLDDLVISGPNVAVSGRAQVTIFEIVTGVKIEARSLHHPDLPRPHCDGCGADVTTGQSMVSFSHTFEALAVNGPYELRVEVSGNDVLGQPSFGTATREFRIEVPAAAPSNVVAQPNPDGTVTVRWSRNTEPDLAGYRVLRRDLAGGAQTPFDVGQPADGAAVSWTDSTAGMAGRSFEYQVVALRPDGDGVVSGRADATSAPANATVPASATSGAPGAPGLPGGGAAPSSRGPVDLSSLAGGSSPTAGRPPAEPDGTFSETLPFGARNNQARRDTAAPSDSVEILGHTTNKRAIVLPIAAGLFMCVAAAHLRRFSRRMFPSSLEAGA